MGGAPGAGPPPLCSRRFLKDPFHGKGKRTIEQVGQVRTNHQYRLGEAGLPGVVEGVVEQPFAGRADLRYLLIPTEATPQTGRQHQ